MQHPGRLDDEIHGDGGWATVHTFRRIVGQHVYTFSRIDDDLTGRVQVTATDESGIEVHHFKSGS